ncbi:ARM repeat-containing protein [Annulohypoxylon truncatum]|uniref:ARM repeat-containing protein n=1 Tax=Annulohypoxylon truncatum TaxID=327061 RepID=UPI0020085FE0|nr:ARM repeat-containing protein [Annulohypoxylon truncatum]KAI1213410.1 ARM repeat-containing protein [Annulohypoxylon truncatum]
MRYPMAMEANTAMEEISIPTITLPEAENLVHELYKPNPPQTISRIQEILQNLQKSPGGWQLADGLLSRPNDNVKFFGALTFTVKLNTESLSDEDAVSVLNKLISFLVTSLRDGTAGFVVKKICSTLVTYFVHYSHTWSKCIRHLSCSLDKRASVPIDGIDDTSPFGSVVQSLEIENFYAITWFARFLANEAEKIDTKSTKYLPLHQRLLDNAGDVAAFLAHGIKPVSEQNTHPEDSIGCLLAWLQYGQRLPNQTLVQQLRTLIHPVINCLPHEELYEVAVDLLTFILEDWHPFLLSDHIESLYSVFESEWGQNKYRLLVENDDADDDEAQFGVFMLAFANAQVVEMMDATNERAQRFLTSIAGLLTAKGYPGVDNKIFVPALEYMGSFVENLLDTLYEAESTHKLQWDKPPVWQIMQAVSESWRKIQYPPIAIYNSWDSTERVAFSDARKDVADFMQSVYTIIGKQLVSMFAEHLLEALPRSSWAELEAAAFCLGALSDCVSDGTSCDDILTKVFGSPLFELLRQGQNVVPVRARQTCLSLIERFSDYFSNHAEFLPAALNLLFSAVGDKYLAVPSSKSIYTLCSSCRVLLTPEVDAFLEQYGALRSHELDSLAEERVVGAIASIIQAMAGDARQASAFQRLLTMVGMDVNVSLQLSAYPEGSVLPPDNPSLVRAYDLAQRPVEDVPTSEVSLQLAIRALRCLSSIAKGLQSPTEAPVDLEASDGDAQAPASTDLNQIQVDIMNLLVRLKETFSSNSEIVDVTCSIIRAGFSESEPGPFVFPPRMVTEFIISRWNHRVATVVNTASVFVTSLCSGNQKGYVGEVLGQLLPWVFSLLHQLSEPEQDPELSQYGLEFAHRVMVRRPEILMSQPSDMLEFLFMFAFKLLNGNEPLPKQEAAEFWTTFITLTTDDQNTQNIVNNAITYLGPKLAESLIQNIGGKAARSELDKLSDPLKKLVVQHAQSRQWLEAALQDPAFPSDKVSVEDKELFLKKVIM